jgi:hypothetical protein
MTNNNGNEINTLRSASVSWTNSFSLETSAKFEWARESSQSTLQSLSIEFRTPELLSSLKEKSSSNLDLYHPNEKHVYQTFDESFADSSNKILTKKENFSYFLEELVNKAHTGDYIPLMETLGKGGKDHEE